jgi:hypothetical protein
MPFDLGDDPARLRPASQNCYDLEAAVLNSLHGIALVTAILGDGTPDWPGRDLTNPPEGSGRVSFMGGTARPQPHPTHDDPWPTEQQLSDK